MSKPRTDITAEKIIPLLDKGYSAQEIAKRLVCGTNLVYARARQGGFVFESGKPPKKKKIKKLCSCCNRKPVPRAPLRNGTVLTVLCAECYHKAHQRSEF